MQAINTKNMDTGDGASPVVDDLIGVNNLEYNLPADLSVCSQKRYAKHFFQNSTYGSSNTTAICILQTGSAFVGEAYLHFKVDATLSAGSATLGAATDLIEQLVIYSRDGTEISRTNNMNLLVRTLNKYKSTQGKIDNFDEMWAKEAVAGTGIVEYSIPMSAMSDLFNYGKTQSLLPSVLMAGLRIEFMLANPTNGFKATGGLVNSYVLSDMYINIAEHQLSDAVALKVNSMAAQHGLEIPFVEYFSSKYSISGQPFNIELRKACSRALMVLMIPQTDKAKATADTYSPDQAWAVEQIWTRIGSIYMPNSISSSKQEHYIYTTEAFSKHFSTSQSCSVSLQEYTTQSTGVFAQNLERSAIPLSGMSVNNSRVIQLNGQFTSAANRDVTTFLAYVRCCRIYLNNTVVEE